jgi:hypothetical protein
MSVVIARQGLRTIDDIIELGLCVTVDTILGKLVPSQTNAACNMLGKVGRFIDLKEKVRVRDRDTSDQPILGAHRSR